MSLCDNSIKRYCCNNIAKRMKCVNVCEREDIRLTLQQVTARMKKAGGQSPIKFSNDSTSSPKSYARTHKMYKWTMYFFSVYNYHLY